MSERPTSPTTTPVAVRSSARALATGTLLRQHLAAQGGVLLAVGAAVLLAALLLAAWPRASATVGDEQVTQGLAGASAVQRDLTAVALRVPAPAPGEGGDRWATFRDALEEIRATAPAPLRQVLAEPTFRTTSVPLRAQPEVPNDVRFPFVQLVLDPGLEEHVEVVDGTLPGAPEPGRPLPVMLAEPAAEALGWSVGEVRATNAKAASLVLSGTFRVLDADDDRWAHAPLVLEPGIDDDLNRGLTVTAGAVVHPGGTALTGAIGPAPPAQTLVVQPLDVDRVAARDADAVVAQLRGLLATPVPLPWTGQPEVEAVSLTTEIVPVLDRALAEQRAAQAMLATVAAGPLGVLLAVLVLAARVLVDRQRRALGTVGARGASMAQLRAAAAAQGVVVGVPAAALGALAGRALTADAVVPGWWVPPLLAGLAPAVVTAALVRPAGRVVARVDGAGGRRSATGRVLEAVALLVGVLAAVAVVERRGAGDDGPTAAPGPDPLLVAAPLLVAVAACVVVLRLYPAAVALVARAARRRTGLVAMLGPARALRSPAGGLTAVLALVVGLTVAVFSTTLVTTVADGAAVVAWQEAGADLRVSGPVVGPEEADDVRALAGVAAAARVGEVSDVRLDLGPSSTGVRAVLADTAELRQVQEGRPGSTPVPEGLARLQDGAVPVVVSPDLGLAVGATAHLETAGRPVVTVVAVTGSVPGVATGRAWVLADRAALAEVAEVADRPRLLLVRSSAADGGAPADLATHVSDVVGPALVQTPAQRVAEVQGSPAIRALRAGSVLAVALSLVLTAATVVLTLVVAAPARRRTLGVLRALGGTARQGRWLVAWEVLPLAVAAVLSGVAVGLGVAHLVLPAAGLEAFVGADAPPPVVVDPALVVGVTGAVLVVVVGAVAAAAGVAGRAAPTSSLSTDEEH